MTPILPIYFSLFPHPHIQAVVWPQADRLVLEGVHHPTPLLKMFVMWSKSRRMTPLLAQVKGTSFTSDPDPAPAPSTSVSPMSCIFDLLNAPTVSPKVTKAILDLLLTVIGYDDVVIEDKPLYEQLGLAPQQKVPEPVKVAPLPGISVPESFAAALILPHIPKLLHYLEKAVSKLVKGSGGLGKKQSFAPELKLLATVSGLVDSPTVSAQLCQLLLPYLLRSSHLPEDVEENTLTSVINLMDRVPDSQVFYR